ncbi:Superfamily II DNA and RNA helicase [Paracoccus thiocyanatus]|uniref:DEAD-box ATP-dependent RNA helicase RhpA n=1 Tax=Paracoccus thiocyanatus TaxID=34006 RepID=A0A1N6NMY5_9RHOB|nr:DEAD/DEAH box helicase [Paracoccus thiocyanatus]SIP93444.1 Superfamily II DNA and RNA helicase [Paracoccus thiocyanatus]
MTKFSDLKLDPKVLKAIAEAGYESPTPIQEGAIPPALEGRDVLGIAQTGTGKTASFTLPMITLLGRGRARARMPRSLVLCPTRELAAQVAENFDIYAKHTRLTKALLIGGVSFGEQDKLIDRGVDVLIATPGRLLDHFERGKLLLTGVQIMVVDEADRMLDMGFIPDIERIFQLTPFTRQTLFFSATMAPEIERITDTFLHAPERIEVARQATTSETITQKLVEITPSRRDQTAKQKRELLRAMIRAEGEGLKNAIIFCNRKTEVDIVAKSLKAHGFDAAPIHGDLDQRHRTATLDGFREGTLRFLVASDVAARGLDIPAVSHVFNFDLPSHAEDYVHRIGRTGRAGRLGTAISIATPADEKYLGAIESLVKQALPRAPVPEGFTLSSAAQDAPRPARESGRKDRGRERRGRRDDSEQRPPVPAAEPRAEASPAPEQVDRRPERAPRDERRDERRERHGDRHDRRDDRRTDRHPVMGMGDHMPEFMTRSFRPGFTEPADAAPADDVVAAQPDAETPRARADTDRQAPARRQRAARNRPEQGQDEKRAEPIQAEPVQPEPVQAEPEPIEPKQAQPEQGAENTEAAASQPEPASAAEPQAVQAAETADAAPGEPAQEKPVRKRKPRVTKPKAEPAPAELSGARAADPSAAEPATDGEQPEAAPAEAPAKPARKTARTPAKPRAPRKPRAKAAAPAEPSAAEQPAAEQPAAETAGGAAAAPETGPDDSAAGT